MLDEIVHGWHVSKDDRGETILEAFALNRGGDSDDCPIPIGVLVKKDFILHSAHSTFRDYYGAQWARVRSYILS